MWHTGIKSWGVGKIVFSAVMALLIAVINVRLGFIDLHHALQNNYGVAMADVGVLLFITIVSFGESSFLLWKDDQQRIEELQRRPYDDEHVQIVKQKIDELGQDERDLLRYLVHYGETEGQHLCLASGVNSNIFDPILNRAIGSQLLEKREQQKAGRTGIDTYWLVRPHFQLALKDVLFPRNETSSPRYFREHLSPRPQAASQVTRS